MRLLLLVLSLELAQCQVYKEVPTTRERKIAHKAFSVSSKTDCELACNCARENMRKVFHRLFIKLKYCSGDICAKFSGKVEPMHCVTYYYSSSLCSFLGDYTENTCMKSIVEYQLDETTTTTPTPSTPTPSNCPPGGIWSEWITIGECPTTCGSYNKLPRKRTCTKDCGDCPCSGLSEDIGPCGIALCPFPAKTCDGVFLKYLNERLFGTNDYYFCGLDNARLKECSAK